MALSNKHIAFIDAWMINGFNSLQAYLVAYPNSKETTAHKNAHKILQREDVQEEIKIRQQENRDRYNVTRDEVVGKLKEIMLTNKFNPAHNSNLKAAEILNKMFGFNFENKEQQNDDSTQITFKIIKSNNGSTGE